MSGSIQHWKNSLDLLECPFTQAISDEEVSHLLLNESEERLEILEWLLLLYQPRLIDILDPTVRKEGRIINSKIERILKAVNTIALCHAEDVDLIKGVAPLNKQKHFINTLIDLVTSKDSGYTISSRDASSYIDKLVDEGIFLCGDNDKFNLLPKDLKAEIDSLSSGNDNQTSIEELRKNYQDSVKEVEKLQGELTDLLKKVSSVPSAGELKEVSAMNHLLSSSIQDLDQLSSGFLHSYESHIGAWCQGKEPEMNDLGPSAKRVHTQLKKFLAFLEDINKLRQIRCDLEDNMKENCTRKFVESVSSGGGTDDNIQRCLGILEESMHRTESGFRSRYSNLLHL